MSEKGMSKRERAACTELLHHYVKTWQIVLLSIMNGLVACLLIGMAYTSKIVMSSIELSSGITEAVLIAVAVIVAYVIMSGVTDYVATRIGIHNSVEFIADTEEKTLRMPYSKVKSLHSVEALKIISDDADISATLYLNFVPNITSIATKLLLGVALMMTISWKLTLIAMAVGLIIATLTFIMKRPLKRLQKDVLEKLATAQSYIQEGVKNVEVVKALNMPAFIHDGVLKRMEDLRQATIRRAKYIYIMNALTKISLEVIFLCLLVLGGALAVKGEISIGDFVVLISVSGIVKAPFMATTNLSSTYFNMLTSAERVVALTSDEEDEYVNSDFDNIIFDNVSYAYGDDEAITNLNLNIHKGDKLAVIGYSGAGKSTFIKLLLGLLSPSSGEIIIEKNGEKSPLDAKLLSCGYIPQNIELFEDTVWNNVACGRNVSEDDVKNALSLAGILGDIMERSEGLNYLLHESGEGLSQGQKQRIGIARALLHDSDLLVLDEPFASLDLDVAKDIFTRLQALPKTVVIVSHDDFVRENMAKVVLLGDES